MDEEESTKSEVGAETSSREGSRSHSPMSRTILLTAANSTLIKRSEPMSASPPKVSIRSPRICEKFNVGEEDSVEEEVEGLKEYQGDSDMTVKVSTKEDPESTPRRKHRHRNAMQVFLMSTSMRRLRRKLGSLSIAQPNLRRSKAKPKK